MRRTEVIRYWLPAAIWSAVLILASGAEASGQQTIGWLQWFLEHTVGALPPAIMYILNVALRKTTHVLAYGLLGALDFRAVRGPRPGWNARWAGIAIVLAALVATIDELHQSFVPSRTGSVGDVVLDVTAAAAVQLVWMLFSRR